MTGPDHFREAEILIEAVTMPHSSIPGSRVLMDGDHGGVLALACVHMLGALVAAIADPLGYGGRSGSQWTDVTK